MTVVLIALLTILLSVPAYATTYYVTKTGNDSASCLVGFPCLTVTHGLTKLTAAGDILDIAVGTYAETITSTTLASGSSTSVRTTIRAHSGDTVWIAPTTGAGVTLTAKSYLEFDGINIDMVAAGATSSGMAFYSSATVPTDYIRIKNAEIKNVHGGFGGIVIDDNAGPSGSTGWEFTNMTIHDITGDELRHGIYMAATNSTADGNNIYNISGRCISAHNNYRTISNNIIRNNTLHNCGVAAPSSSGGLLMQSGSGHKAYNNIIYGNTGAVSSGYGIRWSSTTSSAEAYNNTIYGNTIGLYVQNSAASGTAGNNIVYGNTTNISSASSNITYFKNLCNSKAAGTNCSDAGNPLFVSTVTPDFHIGAGSPAIGVATNLAATESFSTDIAGTARQTAPTLWDIGAYKFGAPPSISVTTPNGGENWQIGTTQTIVWSNDGAGGTVEITADLDGNGSYETPIDASTTNVAGVNSYPWVVAGSAMDNCCKVKVKDTGAATNDVSDAVFNLKSATVTPTITIVSPAASSIYAKGSNVTISWSSTDLTGNVTIELSRNNGSTWETVGTYAYNATDVVYVATTPSSSTCKIKITSVNDAAVTTTSSAFRLGGRLM